MAGIIKSLTIESIDDITPGMIFLGHSTLPTHSQLKRRPFLALWKVGNNVVALPLTSLANMGSSVQVAAEKFQRSTASFYPIAPNSNTSYLPVTATENFAGFIDLLVPVTLGQSSLGRKKSKAIRISTGDLRNVIMAHVGLIQCGQEAVLTEQKEQESEMLLIDRRTYDSIRLMALDLLRCSEDCLPHVEHIKEVARSLAGAFDRPPAAKLILPRPHYPTPSLGSTFAGPPPPPPLPPQVLQVGTSRKHPTQQDPSQQQQQPQQPQPPNGQSGSASCRPHTFPGNPGNPDDDGDGDGSLGTRPRDSSNFYSAPTRDRNQGVQHQKEYQQEKHQHNKHSNIEEDGVDEWTKRDRPRAEEIVPEDEEKEKQLGEDHDSHSPFSQWDLANRGKPEGLIPKNTETQTSTYEDKFSLTEGTQHHYNSEVARGNKGKNYHLRTRMIGVKEDLIHQDSTDTNTSVTSPLSRFLPSRNLPNHNVQPSPAPSLELHPTESLNQKPPLSPQPVATAIEEKVLGISLRAQIPGVLQLQHQPQKPRKLRTQKSAEKTQKFWDEKLAPSKLLVQLTRAGGGPYS
ncbi:hypothetical protein HOY82DRAFT_620598 [Tuber indicum]|nr:hypothetical protein HOY82DRAFT_620598 [Tuber indicum]